MRHFTSPRFWKCYGELPAGVRRLADKNLLKRDPSHPSLHFKRIGRFWSVRVGLEYRALAVDGPEGAVWFWIGTHAEYNKLLRIG
ncbi:MAG TPA: hypothetical protein ENJ90_05525 [Devosia sp.]|nr:hypothetical protein [Devosia sp.]